MTKEWHIIWSGTTVIRSWDKRTGCHDRVSPTWWRRYGGAPVLMDRMMEIRVHLPSNLLQRHCTNTEVVHRKSMGLCLIFSLSTDTLLSNWQMPFLQRISHFSFVCKTGSLVTRYTFFWVTTTKDGLSATKNCLSTQTETQFKAALCYDLVLEWSRCFLVTRQITWSYPLNWVQSKSFWENSNRLFCSLLVFCSSLQLPNFHSKVLCKTPV